jgi:hypothetical protein
MLGPVAGSFVFGAVGYEFTFYIFAVLTGLVAILTANVLPN